MGKMYKYLFRIMIDVKECADTIDEKNHCYTKLINEYGKQTYKKQKEEY